MREQKTHGLQCASASGHGRWVWLRWSIRRRYLWRSWIVTNDLKCIQAIFCWFWLIGYVYELLRCLNYEIWRFSWWQRTDRFLYPCAHTQGNYPNSEHRHGYNGQRKWAVYDACNPCHSILSILKPIWWVCCSHKLLRYLDLYVHMDNNNNSDRNNCFITPCACTWGKEHIICWYV